MRPATTRGGRLRIALAFAVALALGGWLFEQLLTRPESIAVGAPSAAAGGEFEIVFDAAVAQMQQRRYDAALKLWHRALLLDSSIPEVKVNTGFTLFELGDYVVARDFFIDALEQNPYQANAYYGLALTSEKMGDLEGALGAMRTYIHLADASGERKFVRLARAALWEWEAQLAAANHAPEPP